MHMSAHPSLTVIGPPPASFNMAAYVLAQAAQSPEKIALHVIGAKHAESWRFADIAAAVSGFARHLQMRGLVPGDRVLMRLGNTADFPIVFLGAIHAGIVPIPTSAQLTAAEVTQIAAETKPKLVIAASGISLPDAPIPILSEHELTSAYQNLPAVPQMGDPNRPAYIIYTSGTSGAPRAVEHAHRAIWARRMMWDGWYGLRSDDVMLHAGAFNWTYTLGTGLMDPWAIGATALIPAEGTPAGALPGLMAAHHATIFAAAPGVYRRLLRADIPALPHLRHGLSAGEKLPARLADAWRAATGTSVFEAYGMSECSTFISTAPGRERAALGWPQPGRAVALMGADGPVAQGETGVIAVHKDDPGLMRGYLNAPDETAAKFQGEWFLTGDVGRQDADGAFHYVGRTDDMMNAGGYRVSPIEVEDALAAHPDITEVAAVEICVKQDVRIIAAFYVSAKVLDADQLTAHARQTLAGYKVPRHFVRVPALPRGANNKIIRRKLRQDWETADGEA